MNIEQQIVSLQHICINAMGLQKDYPKDEGIKAMLSQARFMIKQLQGQQTEELQDKMFAEREIRVARFRDGGSADYYLMPQNVKIASFIMNSVLSIKMATCLLSGQSVKVKSINDSWLATHKFIKESVGIVLDEEGDFIGNVPNFKRKYSINIKTD
jgi:hypothetical protein